MADVARSRSTAPKLRSACNQCNSSKVKCSGDRNGCMRCRTLSIECIYEVSRVGKVQPPRKRNPSTRTVPIPICTSPPSLQITPNAIAPPARPSIPEAYQEVGDTVDAYSPSTQGTNQLRSATLENALQNWSPEAWPSQPWGGDIFSLGDAVTVFDDMTDEVAAASPGNHLRPGDGPNTAVALERMTGSETNIHFKATLQSTPLRAPSAVASSKLDSKCILACMQMLITLENYIVSELKALDLILDTVRKACDELQRLIQYQQQSRCSRCIPLFIATIHQIVELLEAGMRFNDGEEDMEHDVFSASSTKLMPTFGFGSFSAHTEEQRSWRAHLIRREIKHVEDVLKCLSALSKSGSGCITSSPQGFEQRDHGLLGLETRFKEIYQRQLSWNGNR